jgi:hypothetical protein
MLETTALVDGRCAGLKLSMVRELGSTAYYPDTSVYRQVLQRRRGNHLVQLFISSEAF